MAIVMLEVKCSKVKYSIKEEKIERILFLIIQKDRMFPK